MKQDLHRGRLSEEFRQGAKAFASASIRLYSLPEASELIAIMTTMIQRTERFKD